MTTRHTSIAVYREIEARGLLSEMRWKVYDKLFQHGPATAAELASKFPPSVGGRGEAGNVHARLGELVERGVAYIVRDRVCRITGHTVAEYDVTDQLPTDPPKQSRELLSKKSLEALRRLYKSLDGSPADQAAIKRTVELTRTRK